VCEAAHMPVVWATQVLESLTSGRDAQTLNQSSFDRQAHSLPLK
jgi:hypothetical protein